MRRRKMFSYPPFSWIKYILMALGVWSKPEGEGKYFSFYLVGVIGDAKAPVMEKHWNKMFEDSGYISSKSGGFEKIMDSSCSVYSECNGVLAIRVKHYTHKHHGKCGFRIENFKDVTEEVLRKGKIHSEIKDLEKEGKDAQKEGDIEEQLAKKSQVDALKHELKMNSFYLNC